MVKALLPFQIVLTSARDWWRDWVSMAVLNLCWVLCWATVFLGPPATLVLYDVVRELIEGQEVDYRKLAKTLRQRFLQSWAWFLLNVCFAAGMWLNLIFYSRMASYWSVIFLLISALVSALWVMLQFYALPYLALSPRLLEAFRNALFTLLATPWYSSVMFVCLVILGILARRLPFLLFLGLPPFIAVLGTSAVRERLAHFRLQKP